MTFIRCSIVLWVAVTLLPTLGCDTPDPTTSRRKRPTDTRAENDSFAIAANYLDRFSEHEPHYAQRNLVYHLNQWLSEQPTNAAWEADPLVRQLPRALKETPLAQQYDRLSFDRTDGWALWEAAIMKRVSTWALDSAHTDPLLADWYQAMEGTHGPDHVHRLKMAASLFDWTVRNIQLDPLLKYVTADATEPAAAGEQRNLVPAPMRGIPGPGYRFEPWQVVLYGRGDAWQRARVFIRLARQQQLDVVMLAVDVPGSEPSPRPWLPALLLEGKLYLFDTQLGVPLPGAEATGIATLAEVTAEPELLEQNNVEGFTYPVGAKQLKGVEALIDASPGELSHRMQQVELNFIGQQKLKLTVDPSAVAKQLREAQGISNVRLWPIAIETILYRERAGEVIAQFRELQLDYIVRELIFTTPNPLAKGRWQHLAGNFDSETGRPGAKKLYLDARNSESTIALLAQSPQIQRQLGMTDILEDDPQRRQAQLRSVELMMKQSAQNASYWLGAINYEEGKFPVALDWFERQTLGGQSDTVWETGAAYNVGRSYEQLDEFEKALATYKTQEESASQAGNLVRAKLIEERFGK